jgi:enoyl-CoA hydratase
MGNLEMSNQEHPPVRTQVHPVDGGSIFEIQLNRPKVHNAVDGPTARLLLDAWRRFRDDDDLVVAVLHGAGDKSFCAGADLAGLTELAGIGDEGPMGGTRIVQTKPVLTAAQGYAYAGGLELYCHGHIRIAEPAATFSVACRRWGVPLVDGGTVYLPRLLGWGAALPLIITGQRIDAQRAQQIGLVWEIVPQGQAVARAFDMARQICLQPRDALFADLSSAVRGLHLPLEEALALEAENLAPVVGSESFRQGVQNFLSGKRFWFT